MKWVLQANFEGRPRFIDLDRVVTMGTLYHYPNQLFASIGGGEDGAIILSAENPHHAIMGYARLRAFGWPTRKCPIITMEDLEWIGCLPVWPEPEALEEDGAKADKTEALEATIHDMMVALGNEVEHEGPRLAAMRIRAERDEARKALAEARSQLRAAYGTGAHVMRESAVAYIKACETANLCGKQGDAEGLAEFINRIVREKDRLTVRMEEINAGREEEPHQPSLGWDYDAPNDKDVPNATALAAWGRQGWDTAAALRGDLQRAKALLDVYRIPQGDLCERIKHLAEAK